MSRLFNAVAGVTATAALAMAGSIGAAGSANAIVPHRVTGSIAKVGMPKFYFTEDGPSFLDKRDPAEMVVRSVATGAITGRVHCPGPHPQTEGVAVASSQTFFIDCRIANPQDVASGTRIYRFKVSSSGRVSGFSLIPGGNLVGLRGANLAVTPDGSWLAMDTAKVVKGGIFEIVMINTRTGAVRTWHPSAKPSGDTFRPGSLSFAKGDQELAVSGSAGCSGGTCSTDVAIRIFSPATKGGLLSSGKQLRTISPAQLGGSGQESVLSAYLTQDAQTVVVATFGSLGGATIVELPARGGKLTRTLYRAGPKASAVAMDVDPSGQFILWEAGGPRSTLFGWIGQNKLHGLKFKPEYVNVFGW